jgi:hypothetical protein
MFTQKDRIWFYVSGLLLFVGFGCIAVDPSKNGFGFLTLWVAPLLLLAGFLIVIPGIVGLSTKKSLGEIFKNDPTRHVTGIFVFLSSFILYLTTLEPTASLWDCSEFIASAYKLQVPHTPGNPLLLLIARLFSMFSFGDVSLVARCINTMSAIFSAATVLLVYSIIIDLGKKMNPSTNSFVLILSAASGSLTLAGTDTFWFSAVEAETYAASCFFLFLLFRMILKGSEYEGEKKQRHAILIFYLAGLSYCIHPMCLLAIPVLPIAWYLETRKANPKNVAFALTAGMAMVLFINRFIAVGIPEVAFAMDKFLVNELSFPFYSGAGVFFLILILAFRFILSRFKALIPYTYCLVFLMIGFLPYLAMFLRSGHNPPIDESNPENLQLVKAYMNREGYPTRPLLFGPYFDAEVIDVESSQPVYYKDLEDYKLAGNISTYKYESNRQTILPRIYSNEPDHIASYQRWTGLKPGERPRFFHNLIFLFRYQLGHMYARYLMFNFAGRESDEQNGAWLKPWDVTVTDNPDHNNKARNQYWMIPLLIGVAGIFFQWRRDPKGFLSTTTIFLMTGAFLVVYLNSTPNEPRERDYIYVGSYVAFAIWIGLGINSLISFLPVASRRYLVLPVFILIPFLVVTENYDDHNRSGRTFQIDNAKNVLNSCAPNSILFTGGDNDTFPFWYVQEVEGYRTDVRVVVLSYLNTDWYIGQLRNEYYESRPFRFALNSEDYRQYGPNDVLYVHEQVKNGINARKFLELLREKHPALRVETKDGDFYHSLPSKRLFVPISSNASAGDSASVLQLEVTGKYLQKNGLAILDLMINNQERPMYFNFTSMTQTGLSLESFLVQEGQVFRFDPIGSQAEDQTTNLEIAYNNLMQKGKYDNLLDANIYFNYEDYELRIINPLKQSFNSIALNLIEANEKEKAKAVLDTAIRYFYQPRFKPSFANLQAANLLLHLGFKDEAEELARALYSYNDYRIKNGNDGEAEIQLRQFAGEILYGKSTD